MTLTLDAEIIANSVYNISEEVLNIGILQKIEDDLDIDEKISILFLMTTDYGRAFSEILNLFCKAKEQKAYILMEFVRHHPNNWKKKLLESICVIQNRCVIRKLGLSFDILKKMYLPDVMYCSRNLNIVAKSLYVLCEALTDNQTDCLLEHVKSDSIKQNDNLSNVNCLELHLLYWMNINYISIYTDSRADLKNLLKHVKLFEDVELIYADLQKFDGTQDVLDIIKGSTIDTMQFYPACVNLTAINNMENIRIIKNGICIIISQIIFSREYETRESSKIDAYNLKETFEGLGFNVVVFESLNANEILHVLENISKQFGTAYDCLFVCVLSHGSEGNIITKDCVEVPLQIIEQKICSSDLQDMIKIVVIQACQGKCIGKQPEISNWTIDGHSSHSVSSINQYKNFCMFISTMQGFVSVRHKVQGSWFIQEFCNVLRNGGNEITFFQAYYKIMQSLEKRRGTLYGIPLVGQMPELRTCRLHTDFQFPKYQRRKSLIQNN